MSIIDEFKKPFNIVSLLLTIGSVVLTVIFYYNSKSERDISYHLKEPISKIYDNANSTSRIKVFKNDTIPINDNVYLLTGSIWNSGNIPISKTDIRRPIEIVLSNCKEILEYKITKEIDKEISKFTLTKNAPNKLDINWDYFDPKYGFVFQIIYTGKDGASIDLEGKILGVKEFNKLKSKSLLSKIFYILVVIYYIFLVYITAKYIFHDKNESIIIKSAFPIVIIVLIYLICQFRDIMELSYILN